jgi:phenylalanine-4-hydroxylase
LSIKDHEIAGQCTKRHSHGYSTPIGKLKGLNKSLDQISDAELDVMKKNGVHKIEWQSEIVLEGQLISAYKQFSQFLVLTFKDCKVTRKNEVLFDPSWGEFDLACGDVVVSVFGGAADKPSYVKNIGGFAQKPAMPKSNLNSENEHLCGLYQQLRDIRDEQGFVSSKITEKNMNSIKNIYSELKTKYADEWLLRLEILEFTDLSEDLKQAIRRDLDQTLLNNPHNKALKEQIERGLELCC